MRKKLAFSILFVILITNQNFAQLLTGRVLNESGERASNINVQFLNKANTISTDKEGRFKIMATSLPDTLVFSADGYEPYKVTITEKNIKDINFEVVLLNARAARDEKSWPIASAPRKLAGEVGYSAYGKGSYRAKPGEVSLDVSTYSSFNNRPDRFYLKDTAIGERNGVLAKSKLLTAGEINDFTKWKMWSDYNEAEFKSCNEDWKIFTNHRYSVLLTDKKHRAVMNTAVYLINKSTKDTAWKTFTDNLGRAELWASFHSKTNSADYFIYSEGSKNNNPVEFSNGVNVLQTEGNCNFSQEAEIAFVVDATGSMGDEIEFLKLELEDVIRSTMDKYKNVSLRAGSVFYRDKGDEYITKHVDFNDDLLKTINFIKLQQAGGGGDHPEAVEEAMSTALDSLHWNPNSRIRLMFLFLDAPPHNSAKERTAQLIQKAASMGVHIIPVACSGTDKNTEFFLRSMALATNGTYSFLTDHSGVGNKHIEPTTDKYQVELLNSLLQRTIAQFLFAEDCATTAAVQPPDANQPENISAVKIFPNPTSGRFSIESKKPLKEIYVTDFSGKIIIRLSDPATKSSKQKWEVDISSYASGTYLVKYITDENKWGASKIVLIH